MQKERLEELMLQVKEGYKTIDGATSEVMIAIDSAYESGQKAPDYENMDEDVLIECVRQHCELIGFERHNIIILEEVIKMDKKVVDELIPKNLDEEQKIELFKGAFRRFKLSELEERLK